MKPKWKYKQNCWICDEILVYKLAPNYIVLQSPDLMSYKIFESPADAICYANALKEIG